jgi:hypothetical protein
MYLVADGADITTLEYFNFQFYGNAVWHYFSQAALVDSIGRGETLFACSRLYSRCLRLAIFFHHLQEDVQARWLRTITGAPGASCPPMAAFGGD